MSAVVVPRTQRGLMSVRALPAKFVMPAAISAIAFVLMLRPALDPDLGWHLRNGARILATAAIPRTDPFSHTAFGSPWVSNEWLWDLTLAVLHSLAGIAGPIAVNALLVALSILLVYAVARIRGASATAAALGGVLALLDIVKYAEVRPGMMAALFCALFVFLLERAQRDVDWRWLLPLPLCEALWANTHGSYILGPLLCAVYAAVSLWGQFVVQKGPRQTTSVLAGLHHLLKPPRLHSLGRGLDGPPAKTALLGWAGLGVALFAACLANPIGFRLIQFTIGASRLTFNRDYVAAWRPLDLRGLTSAPLLLTILLSIALPLAGRGTALGKAERILLVICSLALLQSAEFLPLYAVVAGPIVASMLQRSSASQKQGTDPPVSFPVFGAVLAVFLTLTASAIRSLAPAAYSTAVRLSYPVEAVAFIKEHRLPGPLWNEFNWGGYLIEALPELPVAVDSRTEMYGDAFLHTYMDVLAARVPADPVLNRYKIKLILIGSTSALSNELRTDPGWKQLYADGMASIFTRAARS